MKLTLAITLLIFLYIIFQAIYSGYYFLAARNLNKVKFTEEGRFGDEAKTPFRLFISGDSIAVGVGASSFENSVAGKAAGYLSKDKDKFVEFENVAVSGAKMKDLLVMPKPKLKQDLIILIVSSNDVFHFTDINNFRLQTREVITKYLEFTDKLVVVGPGRLFEAGALPFPLRWYYKYISPKYVQVLEEEVRKFESVQYLNPTDKSVSSKSYGNTGGKDNFHPNDNGYRLWFDIIKPVLN